MFGRRFLFGSEVTNFLASVKKKHNRSDGPYQEQKLYQHLLIKVATEDAVERHKTRKVKVG